ncbi:S1-like domain-containing RNA-binding protein [Labilibaculum sp. DW002]|uniref:S1-like domain-containing RNA-binding protein n=1 Tax=Paralabilibaculum antarcticum TaxID=2912572 RepID=A0ABT5VVG4_9BACT|nr:MULTISPECIES: S1-like domain-containing RNA-binding protein [unclassified Labilibaculum]MBI9059778.1 GntR family transcriptional regulator [Labilibaculum sp.]MDE5419406.1 S1-like domain-containing RNA-binding protein [Labilibaculum sp. DW002]
MSIIGQYAELKVAKIVDFGVYLEGEDESLILLPTRYVPLKTQLDDTIKVFIYRDSEDRIIATTLKPFATAGQFAYLQVKEVTNIGAFLEWGIAKDLLVPFSEQKDNMQLGYYYLVYIYVDNATGRIVGTAKLERVLRDKETSYEEGQEVEILIGRRNEMGYQVLINDDALGMLYKNEIFEYVLPGEKRKAFIKKVRLDDKIDVSLQRQGYRNEIPQAGEQILKQLREEDGFLPVNDKSTPEDIYSLLNMSKKSFKKAVGLLYKQKLITIEDAGIYLIK